MGDSSTLSVDVGAPAGEGDGSGSNTAASRNWSALNTAGAVVGGAGLVSIVVGAVFGAKAISKKNDAADNYCDAQNVCTQDGLDLQTEAGSAASVSTATIVIGSVLLAGGIVLMIVPSSSDETATEAAPARSAQQSRPSVAFGLGPASVSLQGRW